MTSHISYRQPSAPPRSTGAGYIRSRSILLPSSPSGRGSGEGLPSAILDNLTCPASAGHPLPLKAERRNARKSGAGFTLIEVVVTLGLFSIASIMAVGLFLVFIQQQRRTLSQQELQNDSRAAIEQISQDLHESLVDFSYYATTFSATSDRLRDSFDGTQDTVSGKNQYLVLRDAQNIQVLYRRSSSKLQRCSAIVGVDCGNNANWQDITPSTLTVQSFTFFMSPSEDPFTAKSPVSCGTVESGFLPANCRWGTTCQNQDGLNTCQLSRGNTCYCSPYKFGTVLPLHPTVTFSIVTQRTAGQQAVTQTFQSTVATRVFKGLSQLNTYVP